MANDNKLYNKDSIESLSPLEFTRLRQKTIGKIVKNK